jgi:hypothetical protein
MATINVELQPITAFDRVGSFITALTALKITADTNKRVVDKILINIGKIVDDTSKSIITKEAEIDEEIEKAKKAVESAEAAKISADTYLERIRNIMAGKNVTGKNISTNATVIELQAAAASRQSDIALATRAAMGKLDEAKAIARPIREAASRQRVRTQMPHKFGGKRRSRRRIHKRRRTHRRRLTK